MNLKFVYKKLGYISIELVIVAATVILTGMTAVYTLSGSMDKVQLKQQVDYMLSFMGGQSDNVAVNNSIDNTVNNAVVNIPTNTVQNQSDNTATNMVINSVDNTATNTVVNNTVTENTANNVANNTVVNNTVTNNTANNTVVNNSTNTVINNSTGGGQSTNTASSTDYSSTLNVSVADVNSPVDFKLTYLAATDSYRIDGYVNLTDKTIVIPRYALNGKQITTINASAFSGLGLTSVIIPKSITAIGASAFSNNSLTTTLIPSSVVDIADSAYANNKLTHVVFEGAVPARLGNYIFQGTQQALGLKTIKVPTGMLGSFTPKANKMAVDRNAFYE